MTLQYFNDHLFDLMNESHLLDVLDIETIPNGYRVTVRDGSQFQVTVSQAERKDNITPLFPEK